MTERGWDRSGRLPGMLKFLASRKRWDRQVGLFLMACCRRVEHLLPVPQLERVLHAGERFVEGEIAASTLARWRSKVSESKYPQAGAIWTALWYLTSNRYLYHPGRAIGLLIHEARPKPKRRATDLETRFEAELCDLLRDIVGNPFQARPAHDPTWLTAAGGAVRRVATDIHEERRWTDLPILADALEDAGCADTVLLDPLRTRGLHARGCWAPDVVLGRG